MSLCAQGDKTTYHAGLLLLAKLIARKTKPEHGNGLPRQVSSKLCQIMSASRFRLLAAVANNGHTACVVHRLD